MSLDAASLLPAFRLNHFKFAEPGLAAEVATAALANGYIDAAEVSDEYEAFIFSRDKVVDTVTADLVTAFRNYLRKHRKVPGKENQGGFKTNMDSLAQVITPTKTPGRPSKRKSSIDAASFKTPAATRPTNISATAHAACSPTALALMTATPASAFRARTTGGKVQVQHNPELDTLSAKMQGEGIIVEQRGPALTEDARYIADTLKNKALYVESRILKFIAALAAAGGPSARSPVCAPSQELVHVAGRITCDSEGKLNEQSVMLEGSMQHSGGASVKLDLSKVASYTLFPGQVVVVEGTNPTGRCLTASRIITAMPAPTPTAEVEERKVTPHSVVTACGPFTTNENLAYEPLQELLEYCVRERPAVLLLMGPFVDAEHPAIGNGQLDITFDDLFAAQVREKVESFLQECECSVQVVLMPAQRDVHHHPVFPQPPLESGAYDPPGAVACLPNPASWSAGGVGYSATSTDVLRHMSAADIRKGSGDRIGQLASYLLDQGSCYPLYPAAAGVNLDACLAADYLAIPEVPDIMLVPSDLGPCAKVIKQHQQLQSEGTERSDVLLINPGRLAKGAAGGTFAHLHVHSASNIRVDIIRV